MIDILLVRHCETSAQDPDAPLTDAGHRQADELAEFLLPFAVDRIVSSPFRRALQTIEPFAERTGLIVHHEPRVAERALSAEPLNDWQDQLRRTWEDFDYRAPGGETSREAQVRGRAALDEIAATPGRPVVVTHGNLLGLLINTIDPTFDHAAWTALSNPDVWRIRLTSGVELIERLWR